MKEALCEPSAKEPFKLLTVDQFATLFNTSRTTVFFWLKTGIIQEGVHYIRLGRILRFRWCEEIFFRNKDRQNPKPKKRPTSPARSRQSTDSGVNLDYGVLTV